MSLKYEIFEDEIPEEYKSQLGKDDFPLYMILTYLYHCNLYVPIKDGKVWRSALITKSGYIKANYKTLDPTGVYPEFVKAELAHIDRLIEAVNTDPFTKSGSMYQEFERLQSLKSMENKSIDSLLSVSRTFLMSCEAFGCFVDGLSYRVSGPLPRGIQHLNELMMEDCDGNWRDLSSEVQRLPSNFSDFVRNTRTQLRLKLSTLMSRRRTLEVSIYDGIQAINMMNMFLKNKDRFYEAKTDMFTSVDSPLESTYKQCKASLKGYAAIMNDNEKVSAILGIDPGLRQQVLVAEAKYR